MYQKIMCSVLMFFLANSCFQSHKIADLDHSDLKTDNKLFSSAEYSINILCISQQMDEKMAYVCPEKYFNDVLNSAKKWKDFHKNEDVIFWYDSSTATISAIKQSRDAISQSKKNILFQDIQEIPIVKNNNIVFSDKMPLYFRIDLLKLVIVGTQLEYSANNYVVFADAEVERLDADQLLSDQYIEILKKSGLIRNGFENQFIQAIKEESVIKTLKLLVNINLLRAKFALRISEDQVISGTRIDRRRYMANLFNSPYCSTVTDFVKFHFAYKYNGQILLKSDFFKLEGTNEWVVWSADKHGYKPFGDIFHPRVKESYISANSYGNSGNKSVDLVLKVVDEDNIPYHSSEKNIYIGSGSRKDIIVRPGNDHFDNVPKFDGSINYQPDFWK